MMTDSFPTARTNATPRLLALPARLVQGVSPSGARNLQAIIDRGRGDVPLKDLLKFRCAKCGSRMTDSVMMSPDALAVQPWRADDAEPTSGAAGHLRGQRPWRAE